MPPLSSAELALGLVAGGITRGLVVGVVVLLAMSLFVPIGVHSLVPILFHSVMATMMLALLGLIGGIWAEKFEHISAVTNFVITPFAFLSGTFYSIERLPDVWRDVALFNPFLYMIDGFRYGFIGHADTSLAVGVVVMLAVNGALWLLALRMLCDRLSAEALMTPLVPRQFYLINLRGFWTLYRRGLLRFLRLSLALDRWTLRLQPAVPGGIHSGRGADR